MTRRQPLLVALFSVLALVVLGLGGLRAVESEMGIGEIRPGMVGIGRTVFGGTRVEEFKAHILGVLENTIGTRRNLILARLEGGPLAHTGVIAGMSGSPVYVDGRLIGAVSYSLGQFSKDPIAGITPIAEMTDVAALTRVRPGSARVQLEWGFTPESLTAAFRQAFARNRPFGAVPQEAQLLGATAVDGLSGSQLGTLLRPIATPLVMSGFDPVRSDLVASVFGAEGFVPAGGGAAAQPGEMPFDGPLKPGDAVGVMLVEGDLHMGGTGTVTAVYDDHVYAFGHPFYSLGPTDFPMTRAYVYTVLASLQASVKLSSTGEVIGTFLQDRSTAISGRLGQGPRTIPVKVTLDAAGAPKRTLQFGVVNDQLFTPLGTYMSIAGTLSSYERQVGAATFAVHGTATLKNHEPIVFDNLFSGDQAASGAASYVVGPLTYLMGNDVERVEMSSLDLTIVSAEERRTATIERVWLDDPRPRAGRTSLLKVLLRTYRGDDVVKSLPIEIPANASGSLALVVSDGARLGQLEQRESRGPVQPRGVDQAIKAINKGRRNSVVYVRLVGSEAGAIVNGERMASLPPSVLGVLEADRNGGSFNPLQSATLGEWELPIGQAVSGARTLTVAISSN